MTDPYDAARMEFEPAGRVVSQAEQDSWLRTAQTAVPIYDWELKAYVRHTFDPAKPVSPLGARLLAASNGLHDRPTDGTPAAEPGTTRHARFGFHWGR